MAGVAFYISGHGFGHASRQIEIVNALGRRSPPASTFIRTSAPRWLFDRTVNVPFHWSGHECDTGVVQLDSLRLDEAGTVRRAAKFYRTLADRTEREAAFLEEHRIDLVISDAPPLACAAAARTGLPCIVVSNFTWDWIYGAYADRFDLEASSVLPAIRAAYRQATEAWRLPMHGGFETCDRVTDLPFVARHARADLSRNAVLAALGLPRDRPLALSSFGGYGIAGFDLSSLDCLEEWTVVITGGEVPASIPRGVALVQESAIYGQGLHYEDLVAACDVVVTKPGYGIIAECIANETAMLYTSRGHFPEYDVLVREMPRFLRCAFIDQGSLLAGRWLEPLNALLVSPQPPERPRTDGAEVAAEMIVKRLTWRNRMNRRTFVWTSVAAGLAVRAPGVFADAGAQRKPAGTLPPSLEALTSMRAQARPITADERRGRIERARKLMAEQKMDALMLCSGTSLAYFTNIEWSGGERLFTCVIPARGEPFFVCPSFEEDRAREQIARGPFTGSADVRTWHEHESPYTLAAVGLRDRGVATGRLGVEETVKFAFSDGVARAARGVTTVSGTPVTAGCRMIKDAHELELMRLASAVTLKAYEAAYKALKEGMTQNDFAELVSTAHARLGFSGGAGVQTGKYSALPHGSIQPQVIREGTILLIDGGCEVEGYASDISRTFVLGKPTDKMMRVFEIERRAQDAALAAAKPGVPCEAVDAAARKVIVDAGYGPDYKYFTHRVGHGMGMDGHEWPYLTRGNTLPLAPGMTFSDEPGIYLPEEFGVRLEDDMHITEEGAKLFTPQSESLEKPF